jgi:hypothetical protein
VAPSKKGKKRRPFMTLKERVAKLEGQVAALVNYNTELAAALQRLTGHPNA